MFRFTIRDVLWLTVVVTLSVMLVLQARSAAFARLESFIRADKSDNLLIRLLAQLEQESPGTVKDEWTTIAVKPSLGKPWYSISIPEKAGSRGQSRPT